MTQRDVESFADFLQYYEGKYVKSRTDPSVMYYIVGPVDRMRQSAVVTTYKDAVLQGKEAWTEAKVWESMTWGLPLIGMTVFNDRELTYLYYRTSRNGGRGFGADRVLLHSFNGWSLAQHGVEVLAKDDMLSYKIAWRCLNKDHVPLDLAFADLNSAKPTRLAYALSYKFGVHLSAKPHPILCYKMHEIGEVLSPSKVRLAEKHTEYKDLVLRVLNPKMEVEIQ